MSTVLRYVATLGFVGFSPVAPGTMGTLVALAVVWAFKPSGPVLLVLAAVATVVGIRASQEVERVTGTRDPGIIVIDEAAGFFVAAAFLPSGSGWLLAAFILFRVFDILKPPPIRRLQDIGGGTGVMMDDVLAGVYANLTLQIWKALS